jgi:phosphoglycolate phosphatase-like HAD superfamily hydrolase
MRPLCVFDLDHTLVRSPLDLVAVKAEIRALAVGRGLALPERSRTWTIGETIAGIAMRAAELEAACWAICDAHEREALTATTCEPGAPEALAELRASGFPLAVWTNNTRPVAEDALARCGLAAFFTTVVTRSEAPLKPDPAGLRLLEDAFPERRIWVVGDSWVDGAAALAGGAGFIAYRADPADLARRGIAARVVLDDLRRLPAWLLSEGGVATGDLGRGDLWQRPSGQSSPAHPSASGPGLPPPEE